MSDLADTIVISSNAPGEMGCGMKRCPFHRWTAMGGLPIWSTCTLPGDGGNVLVAPGPTMEEVKYVKDGHNCSSVKRLPKCLEVKPPQKQKEE